MRRELVDPHGQIAFEAVHVHQPAGGEFLMLGDHTMRDQLGPVDRVGDRSPPLTRA